MDGAAALGTASLARPSARPETSEPAAEPAPSAGPMERPQPDSMPQDLSEALKEATKEVHVQAENAEFMKNFQKGQVTQKGFKLVMASLYHIYVALEEEIERNRDNPVYAPLYFPEELHRKATLERDMAFWYGARWQEAIPYTQATRRYVRRLQDVGRRQPELLVAHAYTRYLGDLSGGQVLKKIAQKALALPSSGEGVDFFTFPNIASPTKFKQLYRSRMNSLEMTPEVRQRVLEEAKTAFLLNIQLFEELQELLSRDAEDQSPSQAPGLRRRVGSGAQDSTPTETPRGKPQLSLLSQAPLLRWVLTLSFLVATVAVGFYVM
ncbi:heme oxygenase 1 [Halichoerus grypus]|uniref:heme oxygenase 1 n=1 Tax=Halichoerus grypus TaxID=9711 RepID=UPI001658D839|nr:heme oxygenase 1 [Halichoerus grypus]